MTRWSLSVGPSPPRFLDRVGTTHFSVLCDVQLTQVDERVEMGRRLTKERPTLIMPVWHGQKEATAWSVVPNRREKQFPRVHRRFLRAAYHREVARTSFALPLDLDF